MTNPAADREAILDAFRRWGYLQADLDPLGRLRPVQMAELEGTGPEADAARKTYCGPIGAEFMHIPDPERRAWVIEQMESAPPEADRRRLYELLARADVFEQTLQRRYVGTKRFSLEGATALIPFLHRFAEEASRDGCEEIVLGMSHRGRLNVMVNFVATPAADLLAHFEDVDPESVLGGGDVKYHLGSEGTFRTADGREVHVVLVFNPSHVEAVDPVVLGSARARQARRGEGGRSKVVPVLLHGDGAFAGQGIAAETLNLADLPGYTAGGTVHVIVNNLIAFTTAPGDLHSSRFASDLARRLPVPIFHVNGEEPEAVLRAASMAAGFRAEFHTDVVIDLIGYRRWGHSEVDDPKFTQPALYGRIEKRTPLWKEYARRISLDAAAVSALESELRSAFEAAAGEARGREERPVLYRPPTYWSEYLGGPYDASLEVDTAVGADRLLEVGERLASLPAEFSAYPKVARLLDERHRMARGKAPVDWGMVEALALGSLLWEGVPVRLTGEDSRRGTFGHRHAALVDVSTGKEWVPLAHLREGQGPFECFDSPLSEAAVLGYEYGYSREAPEALVLWEAQFGDFVNGAQIILDQFLCAGEDKWGLLSGLAVLLPHGYEGQGPEHSSARLERFLQLAAEDNHQVCQPSTAAQYFHLLRRQALRRWRKPLVVLTPKSLLRHPDAASPLADLAQGRFRPVVGAGNSGEADRILLASGKIVHELRKEREKRKAVHTVILSLEQLYPFPEEELARELERFPGARQAIWVQEEPANMGARSFVLARLGRLLPRVALGSVERPESASPATGSRKAHAREQAGLWDLAFGHAGASAEDA